ARRAARLAVAVVPIRRHLERRGDLRHLRTLGLEDQQQRVDESTPRERRLPWYRRRRRARAAGLAAGQERAFGHSSREARASSDRIWRKRCWRRAITCPCWTICRPGAWRTSRICWSTIASAARSTRSPTTRW